MAVLGGVGSVLGAFFGAAILTTLPQVLTVFQEYEQIVLGLIVMALMIFMRAGIVPSPGAALRGSTNDTFSTEPRHRLRRHQARQ